MKKPIEFIDLRTNPNKCPYCGEINDGIMGFEGHAPKVGDITFCINCVQITVFDENLCQRKPTKEELSMYNSNPKAQLIRGAIKLAKDIRDAIKIAKERFRAEE